MSPMLIVLQETNGRFGPIEGKSMYAAENIVALASKSRKLTADISKEWFERIFLSVAKNQSILCLDSWTGQSEKTFDNINCQNKNVKIVISVAVDDTIILMKKIY